MPCVETRSSAMLLSERLYFIWLSEERFREGNRALGVKALCWHKAAEQTIMEKDEQKSSCCVDVNWGIIEL